MDLTRRQQLEAKREQLQTMLRYKEFQEVYVEPFFDILDHFDTLKIAHRIISFRCVPLEFHQLLQEFKETLDLDKYKVSDVLISADDIQVQNILTVFPSVNPFRYVLNAPIIGYESNPKEILQELKNIHKLDDKKVFICYLRYAFLLEISFTDLAKKANNEIFSSWHGDTIIFPSDHSWIIDYTLEDEWLFSFKAE